MNHNILIDLINSKSKPNLNNFSFDQLVNIVVEYNKEHDDIFSNGKDSTEKNQINLNDIKNKTRCQIEKIIIDIWKDYEIRDCVNNKIECSICFEPITNSNGINLKCFHQMHSSCLLDYIFSNFITIATGSNLETSMDKSIRIKNLFRCPKCRKYLTLLVEDKNLQDKNIYQEENSIGYNGDNNDNDYQINEYANISIDLNSGLWVGNINQENNPNVNIDPDILSNIILINDYLNEFDDDSDNNF
jgi:hypothetical protein